MIDAQELIEVALRASPADETMVLVTDRSEAALRWAGSSLTTNGVTSARSVTVIAVRCEERKPMRIHQSTSMVPPWRGIVRPRVPTRHPQPSRGPSSETTAASMRVGATVPSSATEWSVWLTTGKSASGV